MKKIRVFFNICGIGGKDNSYYYLKSLQSVINQTFDSFEVVVSSCQNSFSCINLLYNHFKDQIYINWIHDLVPVNVSFNHSVLQSINRLGPAEGYLYLDSGIDFEIQKNILSEIYSLYRDGFYGMVSVRTNTNTGFPAWLGIGNHDDDSETFNKYFRNLKEHFVIPVGKAINLHVQLYSNKLVEYYGVPIMDVMSGEAHESVGTFITSALGLKWVIHKDLEVIHRTSIDGPSSGFPPWQYVQKTGKKPCFHGFCCDDILERMKGGHHLGLGFEEVSGMLMHDESQFNECGFCNNNLLKEYIKQKLFLQEDEFNYNKINCEWIQ